MFWRSPGPLLAKPVCHLHGRRTITFILISGTPTKHAAEPRRKKKQKFNTVDYTYMYIPDGFDNDATINST